MKPASVKDEEELKESARALSWFGICYYTVLLWPGVPQTHVSPWSHETDHFSVGKMKSVWRVAVTAWLLDGRELCLLLGSMIFFFPFSLGAVLVSKFTV